MTVFLLRAIIGLIIITTAFMPTQSTANNHSYSSNQSIVPLKETISDFETRWALAKILSYTDETLIESIREYTTLLKDKPDNSEVRLETAKVYMRLKKYEAALVHLNYVLSGMPDDYDALSTIGDIYLYTAKLKDAAIFYGRAHSAKPSDHKIQKKLALALIWAGNDKEALPLIIDLQQRFPEDKEIVIELSRLYTRKNEQQKALPLLYGLHKRYPDDPDILVETADIEASLGHAAKCRRLYIDATRMSDNKEQLLLKFAGIMNMWGDFYKIESIYNEYLKNHPDATEILLRKAWLLVSSERYEEAEGIYLTMLMKNPDMAKALLDMAKLKLMTKDFSTSLSFIEKFLIIHPEDTEGLFLKAESLYYLKKYNDSIQTYDIILRKKGESNKKKAEASLNTGKVYLKQKDKDSAQKNFEDAGKFDPESVKAQFFLALDKNVGAQDFIDITIQKNKISPQRLVEWAELYAAQGFNKEAILFYVTALKKDPEFFPASMGLAQIYAIDHRYRESIELFSSLERDLPETSKILIWHSRALGWSKEYSKSIQMYQRVQQLNQKDPVPQKEKARVAVWGKMMEDADKFYRQMYKPSVDKKLTNALSLVVADTANEDLLRMFDKLNRQAEKGSIYEGYEEFFREYGVCKEKLPPDLSVQIETALIDLLPAYRIQKEAFLENKSKGFAWHKKFIHAMDVYEKLIDFGPGNEEAIFDYAQVECALGLCKEEAISYNKLLNIDPLHSLANIALERQKRRNEPFFQFNYSYWMEDGRGDLSRISRNRFDLTFNVPLFCRYYAGVTAHRWLENPWYNHKTYGADGYSLFFGGTVNQYIKGEAKWTFKKYSDNEISSRNTGHAFLWFNMKDYAHVGAGYEKADEIYNYFGIQQGVQSDSWWAGIRSDITRRLEINGKARFFHYNDSNSGQHHFISTGYAVTDHPRIFKVTLSGEYRDTNNTNLYLYSGNNLVNIIHPYWTPQDYTGAGIVFEWYHDYSKLFFCGNELRFYDVKVSFGTDSENNPAAKIEAELHHQFYDHWTIGIKGMLHSSPQWSANGLWALLKYQF